MIFNSFSELLDMGGHGLYVWLCYGMTLLIFVVISIQPILVKKSLIRQLSQIQRRNEADQVTNLATKSGER